MKYENNLFDLQGPIFKALQHYVMRSSMTALNPIECKSIHAQNDYLMILVKKTQERKWPHEKYLCIKCLFSYHEGRERDKS